MRQVLEVGAGVVALTGPLFAITEPMVSFGVVALAGLVFFSSYRSQNMGGIWLATLAMASLIFVTVGARLIDFGSF